MPRTFKQDLQSMVGSSHGNWLILEYVKPSTIPFSTFKVECGCGTIKQVRAAYILHGVSKSCGCKRISNLSQSVRTHGDSIKGKVASEYRIWRGIKQRCLLKTDPHFSFYGGRGIKISDRWVYGDGEDSGYECFLKDMGRRPSPDHSIDRINTNGNYESSNCRWATRDIQVNNTRRNVFLEHDGDVLTLAQWADRLSLNRQTVYARFKRGLTTSEVLFQGKFQTGKSAINPV